MSTLDASKLGSSGRFLFGFSTRIAASAAAVAASTAARKVSLLGVGMSWVDIVAEGEGKTNLASASCGAGDGVRLGARNPRGISRFEERVRD